MTYNAKIVLAYFEECGLPEPLVEFQFAAPRKWRFDFAWPFVYSRFRRNVALEIQGGIFIRGRHNQGASLLKEWEKLNEAACMGWRILYCQPCDLCTLDTVHLIKRVLAQ